MKLNTSRLLAGKLCLILLLAAQQVYAEKVENLYSLTSLVANTSDEQRAIAANQALRKLLVRVSGTEKTLEKMPPEDFSDNPKVYAEHSEFQNWVALSSAQELVNQYSYTASSELLTLASGKQLLAQQLELTFDEAGVKRLLRQLQAPVWDAYRPKVLFWVALESRNGRTLLTEEANAPLSSVLAEQNKARGIPYQLPDLIKYPASNTLFSDIWGGFSQQIINASDPYQPDAIAVGKIKALGNHWQVEWRLFTGRGNIIHTVAADTLREALQEGVNFTAEELASHYASQFVGEGAGTYKIMVANVRQIEDYASLNNYLNSLSLTSKVRVVQSREQQMWLEITLQGGLDQLRANLALDGRLKEASFFGLQQATSMTQQLVDLEQEQALAEPVDAYFRWQAN